MGVDAARRFRTETRCVTALYERCLSPLTTRRIWKILVECVPSLTHPDGKIVDALGVAVTRVPFDWDEYRGASDRRKKELALGTLKTGVRGVAARLGWRVEPFEEAHRRVIELEFVNRVTWRKRKSSPDRKLSAEIEIEYELDRATITLVVKTTKDQELKRQLLVETTPSEFILDRYLGELKWLSRSEVALLPKWGDPPPVASVELAERTPSSTQPR